jgi:uncharacterized protein
MNIAILGGGASGMVTAYWLDQQGHRVTVFENQPILGGHIRTINKNIHAEHVNLTDYLECGVLEFPSVFYNFLNLMKELDIVLKPIEIGSAVFLKDGNYFLSPSDIEKNFTGFQRTIEFLKLDSLYLQSVGLQIKMLLSKVQDLHNQPLSKFLDSTYLGDAWMALFTMYSYSIPFDQLDNFPAELAIPILQDYVFTNWYRIEGGVYSYIEKILERFKGNIVLNCNHIEIKRSSQEVTLLLASGEIHKFDKIVFATPPDQVLQLLADPTAEEIKHFASWQKNEATTVIHTDTMMYKKYGIRQFSEFDFLQTPQGWGYNAYLNTLCGVSSATPYSLAFNLDSIIAKDHIIYTQKHHTPLYTVESFQYKQDIIDSNGKQHTYHVGAYLGDGLHEGAITSAKRVAALIG